MAQVRRFQDLIAWQRAIEVAQTTYRVTRAFPIDERFGLTNQMRRAAVSVSANIAEGYGRGSAGDFLRFLRIARGSLNELESLAHVASLEGFLGPRQSDVLQNAIAGCGRPLAGLIRRANSNPATSHP